MNENNTTSTVLVVDDEEIGRESMEFILESEGYNLAFAASGEEAIAKARVLQPDVILLDVMMPRMDGFDTCAHMRKDPLIAEVPIVFVTALSENTMRLMGLESGADDYITKPVNRHELRLRIRNITRLNRYRKLLAERSKFEWVVEEAQDGYLLLTEHDLITYANSTARRYLALSLHLELPQPAITFSSQASRQFQCEPHNAWEDWPLSCETTRYLVRAETPKERALWLEVRTHQLTNPGVDGTIVSLRDVTEQVSRTQKTWFFQDIIAHKLNTPLQALGGLDYVLAQEELNENTREMLELARNGSHELQERVYRILHYLNEDRGHDNPLHTPLDKLIEVMEDLRTDLQVSLHLHGTLPEGFVAMSQANLYALLWELCGNAKKFHPQHTPQIEIQAQCLTPKQLTLLVRDDGCNLPSEVLEKVWIPYFQHEKFFTGQQEGMGLGLPMVASLVWNAGGSCCLRNREHGVGIEVEIILPTIQHEASI